MTANGKNLSKFIALVLRHRPADFGVSLDAQGFTELETLWHAVEQHYHAPTSRADFDAVFASEGGQQRFEVIGGRVRAMYGHSTQDEIQYAPVMPPETLYHGTVEAALASIRESGLSAMKRQYVHLSTDIERASTVAYRRGKALILVIRAREAHDSGVVFYHPEPKHYLVKHVPPEYIDFPE